MIVDKIELLIFMIFAGGAFVGIVLSLSAGGGLKAFRILGFAYSRELEKLSSLLTSLNEQARRSGLLSIEKDIFSINNGFIQLGLQLIVDGTDPELVDTILENKIALYEAIARSVFAKIFFSGISIASAALCSFAAACTLGDMHAALFSAAAAVFLILFPCLSLFLLYLRRLHFGKLFLETAKAGMLSIQAGNNPRIAKQIMESHYEDNLFFEPRRKGEVNK